MYNLLIIVQHMYAYECMCEYVCVFLHVFHTWLRTVAFVFHKTVYITNQGPRYKEAEILSLPLNLVDNKNERIGKNKTAQER